MKHPTSGVSNPYHSESPRFRNGEIQELSLSEAEQKAIRNRMEQQDKVETDDPHRIPSSLKRSAIVSGAMLILSVSVPQIDNNILWKIWAGSVVQPHIAAFVKPKEEVTKVSNRRDGK